MTVLRAVFLTGILAVNVSWIVVSQRWWIERQEHRHGYRIRDTFGAIAISAIPVSAYTMLAMYLMSRTEW